MKITAFSAVLCLVASTTMASETRQPAFQGHDNHIVPAIDKRADRPQGVGRHEHQNHHKSHKEHGLEAHNDGHRKHHEDNDEDEDEDNHKEKKGHDDDEHEEEDSKEEEEEKRKKGDREDKDEAEHDGDKKTKEDEGKKGEDKKKGGDNDKKKGGEDKKGEDGKKKGGNAGEGKVAQDAEDGKAIKKQPGVGAGVGAGAGARAGAPAAGKGDATANPKTDPSVPRDLASPLWLVQPFGASVWEQGRAYVITWGPNPDPVYAKALKEKAPVDIRLMQGPPEHLREVSVLKTNTDSSLHAFRWTVPTTLAPAKDYSIRLTHEGQVDTYSHYFEVVKAGDPRSSKSNVGEPILLPKKGDVPMPLDKGNKPAVPPNPLPAEKTANPAPAHSVAAKPATHASGAETRQGVNILALTMTLFGAVYLL